MRARNTSPCAPAYSGCAVPKCWPMSPSPAAPSSASTIACATASPSECPSSAGSPASPGPRGGASRPRRRRARRCRSRCAGRTGPEAAARIMRARSRSCGVVILKASSDPPTNRTAPPAAANSAASSVYSMSLLGGLRVRGEELCAQEPLGRLRGDEFGAVHRRDDRIAVDAFERVHHGQRGDRADARCDPRRHGAELSVRGERSGRVVHEDDVDVVGKHGESGCHGALPRVAAVHDPGVARARHPRGVVRESRRHDDDHARGRGGVHGIERVLQDRATVDVDERLGRTRTEPGAGAGGHDDHGGARQGRSLRRLKGCHALTLPFVRLRRLDHSIWFAHSGGVLTLGRRNSS